MNPTTSPQRIADKPLETWTRDEKSLLLYFETVVVDESGRITDARMNDIDRENARLWNEQGFVSYGRVASEHLKRTSSGFPMTTWCRLSDEAWECAHRLRRRLAATHWNQRTWRSTEEKRAES